MCVTPTSFPPTWDNLPTSVDVNEDIALPMVVYTVSATDPDGDDLLYYITATVPDPAPFIVDNSK